MFSYSFHVGSACFDGNAYVEAVVIAKEIFNVGIAIGCHLNILDIGGGFPGIKSDGITMEEVSNCFLIFNPMLLQLFHVENKRQFNFTRCLNIPITETITIKVN